MIPQLPSSSDSLDDIQRMAQSARRVLLILEDRAPVRLLNDPALEAWRGYEAALALVGLKLCLELRRRGRKVPLEFFVLRAPKGDFELPSWMTEEEEET